MKFGLAGLFVTIAAASIVALWFLAIKKRRLVALHLIILAAIIPTIMVALVLYDGRSLYGSVRVSLQALRFDLNRKSNKVVTVGGSALNDDIVVPDLPEKYVSFTLSEGNILSQITPISNDATNTSDIGCGVAIKVDNVRPFHNAVPVDEHGITIFTAPPGAKDITAFQGRLRLTAGDVDRFEALPATANAGFAAYTNLPNRRSLSLRPLVSTTLLSEAYKQPAQRIYPLRSYGVPIIGQGINGSDSEELKLPGDDGAIFSFACNDGNPSVRRLFSWKGLSDYYAQLCRRPLFFIIMDPRVAVETPNHNLTGFSSLLKTLDPNSPEVNLAFYRVDYKSRQEEREEDARKSHCQERRSITAKRVVKEIDNRPVVFLDIFFDTPSLALIPREFLNKAWAEARKQQRNQQPAFDSPIVSIAVNSFDYTFLPKTSFIAYFPVIGKLLQEELFCQIKLPRSIFKESPSGTGGPKDKDQLDTKLKVFTPQGAVEENMDCRFWVGDNKVQALLRLTELNLPWGMFPLALLFSLISMGAGYHFRRRPTAFILLSAVDYLLALRILIAFEGAYIDPASASAVWKSLAAFVAVPWALRWVITLWDDKEKYFYYPAVGYDILVIVTLWLIAGHNFGPLIHKIYGKLPASLDLVAAIPAGVAVAFLLRAIRWVVLNARGVVIKFYPLVLKWFCIVMAIVGISLIISMIAYSLLPQLGSWIVIVFLAIAAICIILIIQYNKKKPIAIRSTLYWSTAAVFLFLFLRFPLLFVGMKERIGISSFSIAWNAIYEPLSLIYFAMLWSIIRSRFINKIGGKDWILHWWIYLLTMLFVMVAIPLVSRDIGASLIYLPPVATLFSLPFLFHSSLQQKLRYLFFLVIGLLLLCIFYFLKAPLVDFVKSFNTAGKLLSGLILLACAISASYYSPKLFAEKDLLWRGFVLALPLFGCLVFFLLVKFLFLGPNWSDNDNHQVSVSSTQLKEKLGWSVKADTNMLRLLSLSNPEAVEGMGTVDAEQQALSMECRGAYSRQGLMGRGFLDTQIPVNFQDTNLNDNLSVVHFLAPLGTLGGIGLLGLLAALSVIPLCLLKNGDVITCIDGRSALGLCCLWTIFWAAFYMFAGNTQLLPFIGKNVYFLAADSHSDALEGMILIALALWAFWPLDNGRLP